MFKNLSSRILCWKDDKFTPQQAECWMELRRRLAQETMQTWCCNRMLEYPKIRSLLKAMQSNRLETFVIPQEQSCMIKSPKCRISLALRPYVDNYRPIESVMPQARNRSHQKNDRCSALPPSTGFPHTSVRKHALLPSTYRHPARNSQKICQQDWPISHNPCPCRHKKDIMREKHELLI